MDLPSECCVHTCVVSTCACMRVWDMHMHMCKFKGTTETKQIQLSYFLHQKKLCVERHRIPSDATMVTLCHPHICAASPVPPLSMPNFQGSPVFAYDLHS